jgi:hypothetical protein
MQRGRLARCATGILPVRGSGTPAPQFSKQGRPYCETNSSTRSISASVL